MQRSNTYILVFSAALTIIIGGLLSLASVSLSPYQKKQEKLATMESILGAVMKADTISSDDKIIQIYENRIESTVVNYNGEEVTEKDGEEVTAEKVNIGAQYKKSPENRLYPVFKYKKGPDQPVMAYVLPVYGKGLWDDIWGYLAVKQDLKTIKGVVFSHAAETPGLGARISSNEIQSRYQGKKIYDENGKLVSVTMVKGETGNPEQYNEHHVDGMSGATMTANGVNEMLYNYLKHYQNYFARVSEGEDLNL